MRLIDPEKEKTDKQMDKQMDKKGKNKKKEASLQGIPLA